MAPKIAFKDEGSMITRSKYQFRAVPSFADVLEHLRSMCSYKSSIAITSPRAGARMYRYSAASLSRELSTTIAPDRGLASMSLKERHLSGNVVSISSGTLLTIIKHIMVSSVAVMSVAETAPAADLPTKKAAPTEYVKICNVGGMAGFIIPGSSACLKISGLTTGQIAAGNTKTSYAWIAQGMALSGSPGSLNPSFGYTARLKLVADVRQDTAYGALRGLIDLKLENGDGFNNTGNAAYINLAYLQWAGITAGKAPSFFAFYGGGIAWVSIFSPDQQVFNQPNLFAYTAKFGMGFSAAVAAQSSGSNGFSGGGTNLNVNTTNFGSTAPDVVANLRVDQSWGSAQLSAVAHQVHVYPTGAPGGPSLNTWGWGFNAGASFKLPQFGPADKLAFQGTYTKNAILYSGIPEAMWTEDGAVNGNGLAMSIADAYYAGLVGGVAHWATPTAWSASTTFEHFFSQAFSLGSEASWAQLTWSGSLGQLSSDAKSWVVAVVAHWYPTPVLDLEIELGYQNTRQSTPGLYKPGIGTINGVSAEFPSVADGFASRFVIIRYF
jgi:hypothetical protein